MTNIKDELVGFSEVESNKVYCGDCGYKLIEIVVTETNENRLKRGLKPIYTKYKVLDCPKCGGSSFDTKTYEGSTIYGPLTDNYVVECLDCDSLGNDFVYGKLSLRKR